MKAKLLKIHSHSREFKYRGTLYLASVVFVLYIVGLFSITPGELYVPKTLSSELDCSDKSWQQASATIKNVEQQCPNIIEVLINPGEIDFKDIPTFTGLIRILPAGDLGQAVVNSGVAQRNIRVVMESFENVLWDISAKQFIGSRGFRVSVKNSERIRNYPFDQYTGDWTARVEDFQLSTPLPTTLTVANKAIYGWNLKIEQSKNSNSSTYQKDVALDGRVQFTWNATRSSSVKLAVGILVAVVLLGMYSATRLTRAIFEAKRPPSLNALGWLATTLFALIEIRSRFPGDPPFGISLDLFVTYPAALCLLILILLNTLLWIRRDDWEMKNKSE